jgi:hypothetical protein
VRMPADWDAVDPIPAVLAEILDRPLPGPVDPADVVPAAPSHVHAHA